MLGVYSVLTYLIAQRRRELVIRTALGATAADLRRLVIGDTLRMAVLGLVVGLGGALLAVQAQLASVRPETQITVLMA